MEFEGIVTFMGSIDTVETAKGPAEKVTFVVEEAEWEYKKSIVCDQFGEKQVSVAKMIAQGDRVKVSLSPRAREYNGRWYNAISARKVEVLTKGDGNTSWGDDLPF